MVVYLQGAMMIEYLLFYFCGSEAEKISGIDMHAIRGFEGHFNW